MNKFYTYICTVLVLILTSCGHNNAESSELLESKNEVKQNQDTVQNETINEQVSVGSGEIAQIVSEMNKTSELNEEYFVYTENIIKDGYFTNIKMNYPQLYIKSGKSDTIKLKESLNNVNSIIYERILYDEIMGFHSELFQANIESNYFCFEDMVISIAIVGELNDNGLYHKFISSLTYDINNGEELYLFDIIEVDKLLELIKEESFVIEPIEFEINKTSIKDALVNRISNAWQNSKDFGDFFLTEEYLVLYTELSPNSNESILIKIPYTY